jgi:bifunctional DNA-binding transcriptional regulator/antitoxin component of YhaV-PrlF toxin-antitoxin module
MTTLTVTAKGQVTIKQDLLRHLGIRSGQKIEVTPLADGKAMIQAARQGHDVREVFGILTPENKANISLTLEEIDEISRKGWAGEA